MSLRMQAPTPLCVPDRPLCRRQVVPCPLTPCSCVSLKGGQVPAFGVVKRLADTPGLDSVFLAEEGAPKSGLAQGVSEALGTQGWECGDLDCSWYGEAHAVSPARGGLDLRGHVPGPSIRRGHGAETTRTIGLSEESRWWRSLQVSERSSPRLPPALQMGKPRPREDKYFACSLWMKVWRQAWNPPRMALGWSPPPSR